MTEAPHDQQERPRRRLPSAAPGSGEAELQLAFSIWHRLERVLLAVTVPLLALFGYFAGEPLFQVVTWLAVPALLLVLSSTVGSRQFKAAVVALGFVWGWWLLVLWSGGATEAHLYALIVIGLVALYRDPLAVSLAALVPIVVHVAIGTRAPDLVYTSTGDPVVTSMVHILALFAAWGVPVLSWQGLRRFEERAASDATRMALSHAEASQEAALQAAYASSARRSQTMLEHQIEVIDRLEREEKDPATLQQLFVLDHLATRMGRQSASLLVMAGQDLPRRASNPVHASEVIRGAIAEVEDYARIDIALSGDVDIAARAVAPLLHLLAELIENATQYSPPDTRVRVEGGPLADGGMELRVVDRGLGLDDAALSQYNELLASVSEAPPTQSSQIGFHVIGRLAARYGLLVALSHNRDGAGVTAQVLVPPALVVGPAAGVPAVPAGALPPQAASVGPQATPVTPMAPTRPAAAPAWAAAVSSDRSAATPATPPVAPAAPAAVPAVAAHPVAEPAPQVTAHPPAQVAPLAQPAPAPAPAQPAPAQPAGQPAAAHAPAPAVEATRASPVASGWSYSGLVQPEPEPVAAAPELAGRGSRRRIGGRLSRPDQPEEAADSTALLGGGSPFARGHAATGAAGPAGGPAPRAAGPAGPAVAARQGPVAAARPTGGPAQPGTDAPDAPTTPADASGLPTRGGAGFRPVGPGPVSGSGSGAPPRGFKPGSKDAFPGTAAARAASPAGVPSAEPSPRSAAPPPAPRGSEPAPPPRSTESAPATPSAEPAAAARSAEPAPEPAAEASPQRDAGAPAAQALPKRRRGAHLPSELRDEAPPPGGREPRQGASREQSRSALSSYQNQLRRGRQEADRGLRDSDD